jgi:hypothetical protein
LASLTNSFHDHVSPVALVFLLLNPSFPAHSKLSTNKSSSSNIHNPNKYTSNHPTIATQIVMASHTNSHPTISTSTITISTSTITATAVTDLGPASPHAQADAAKVMSHTNEWTPQFNRRQSWNKEDQKRELQMSGIEGVKTGPGFSERG